MSKHMQLAICVWSLVAAAAFAADGGAVPVLVVAPDGSAPFKSVQAAVDAAPDFAVIRIAPGTYDGPLQIRKPITVEGAGWQLTHIRGRWLDVGEFEKIAKELSPDRKARLDALVQKLKKSNGEEFGRLYTQLRLEFGPKPVLTVEGAPKVVLKGLRLSYLGPVQDGGWLSAPMARFDNSTVTVEACALVGSAVEGLFVENAADVQIRDSLFGGIRASGIVVNIPVTSRVLVQNCEIRNCGYAGVMVKGEGQVHVDRCLLAGIDYHAVRYDDASPKLTGNILADINRGGIYADGQTQATVSNNLFLGCAISGRGANRDVIEHNTFLYARGRKDAAWNGETAVWINDASAAELRNNVFARYEHGVTLSALSPDLVLEGNLFDTTAAPVVRWVIQGGENNAQRRFEKLPLPDGNRRVEVRFVDESKDDFALDPTGLGGDKDVGARSLRNLASAWPEVPEERELIDRVQQAGSKNR